MFGRFAANLASILTFSRRGHALTGPARVIDGDTIVVAGELVRLHGIDAPELDQTFWWRGERVACGMMAMAALEALTAGIKLRCEAVERDRHGRLVAKCFSPNGIDIGRRLVSAGWALAYRRYASAASLTICYRPAIRRLLPAKCGRGSGVVALATAAALG